ncbi:ABC transporter permease [Raoultibacter massiliensis]|uniref:ABC transporter permease n=1 Tax=Raoultibacter massiliensis TaxID=1852371 RepID=UPI000C8422C5|nr:ABC transporter permease [Raoultibacter massiliensis]
MKWLQIGKEAAKNVGRNKLRTALTMLGLVIGISSVIVLVGMSDGSNRQVAEQMKALGGDIISAYVFEGSLAYDDMAEVRALPAVADAAPSKFLNASVSAGTKRSNRAMVEASDEHYLPVRNLELAAGRNLSSIDRENKSKVCVIGGAVARDLFGTTDAVGRAVKLAGDEFTVVGVLEEKGESMGLNTEGLVLVPFQSAGTLGSDGKVESAYVRAVGDDAVQLAKGSVSDYLERDKGIDPMMFSVNTQDELLGASGSVNKTMTLLLAGVASISLLVAGIGVMNVMLVSVAERVREIGIKKALGARRGDILVQFLVEALVMSLFGGVLGILLGIALCAAAEYAGIPCVVSPTIMGVAAGASILIGLAFGIFPAHRASQLHPVEALRQE